MMNLLIFILLLSATQSFTGFSVVANLECTTQQPYVCAGDEVNCICTAFCNEGITWSLPPNFRHHQVCNICSPETSSAAHAQVTDCNSSSCSNSFTSRLSYNASLGMEDSTTIIQIKCSIVPDPPGSQRIRGCSPTASHRERDSTFTLCVTNCAGTNSPVLNPTSCPTVQPTTVLNLTPSTTVQPTSIPNLTPSPTGIGGTIAGATVSGTVAIVVFAAIILLLF